MGDSHAVYGLRVSGLDVAGLGHRAPESWPHWTIGQVVGPADDAPGMSIWEAQARIGIPGTGELRLDRSRQRITLRTQTRWSGEALLHPGLSPAAAVIAHWMGRSSMHASAVVLDGRAWGIVAERGGGKSTTAALLAARGCPLLTDDLLVVEQQTCFAGPGAVDLRADAAERLGGRALGRLGSRQRWRKPLPIGGFEVPLAGWIELRWSDVLTEVTRVEVADRLLVLSRHAGLPVAGEHLLALADRPMLRLGRPQSAAVWSAGVDRLLEAMSGSRSAP